MVKSNENKEGEENDSSVNEDYKSDFKKPLPPKKSLQIYRQEKVGSE